LAKGLASPRRNSPRAVLRFGIVQRRVPGVAREIAGGVDEEHCGIDRHGGPGALGLPVDRISGQAGTGEPQLVPGIAAGRHRLGRDEWLRWHEGQLHQPVARELEGSRPAATNRPISTATR
jgi:hypothetical protein